MNSEMKFLVVDDFAIMRRIVKNVLNELGYNKVTEAEDGGTVLPMLRQGEFEFLIADWNMPSMPALEVLKAVRADPKLASIPVLMLTAEAKRDQILEAVKAGVSGYVLKPFTSDVLKKRLAKILNEATSDALAN